MNEASNDQYAGITVLLTVIVTIILVVTTQAIQSNSANVAVDSTAIRDQTHQDPENAVIDQNQEISESIDPVNLALEDAPRLRFEAEEGVMHGTFAADSAYGYSGNGYVTDFTDDSDYVNINITVEEPGLYQLYIGYRAPNGYKETDLYVNEQPFGQVKLEESSSFEEVKATRVLLEKGETDITIGRGWGYYDLDYIDLQRLDESKLAYAPTTEKLSNPNASPEAVVLMNYLNEQAGKAVLSGQQLYSQIANIEHITGKRPAVVGFDFIDYSPTRVSYGAQSTEVEAALDWHKQGGIVSFLWHWNAPTGLIDEPGKEWWRGFYTDSVTFDLAAALADKTSEEYALLLSDMDVIAQQIKILQLNDVPVLFRPLHEADGGWFWWGASGPEAAKELYQIMYDRFVNEHQLHNLIWVWNSIDPAWYPGDDVVDIVSYDSYPVAGDHSPIVNIYDELVELTGGKKYIAMMENGSIPDPAAMEAYGAHWGLFITWSDHFTTDGLHNSNEYLQYVYQHPRVITLEELPDWGSNP
ncbi:glycosyl hydrolase [Paenibacillus septentrionalis]|uniref:Glycosyl hydrolase n=1 Tax=Paenibacillus septentrionalis TaxID=429342 RepID=A0ABW1VAP3_9BACL